MNSSNYPTDLITSQTYPNTTPPAKKVKYPYKYPWELKELIPEGFEQELVLGPTPPDFGT